MGKRSNFDRIERDFYPTPREAVFPLYPHLEKNTWYVEPCAGDGKLVNLLSEHGHSCLYFSDIEPKISTLSIKKQDMFDLSLMEGTTIITNPPWNRKILHHMIDHFSNCDMWLLFDADWIHTKQSIPYLSRLKKIVSVGRVKWIPESIMTGKDNCAWHFFSCNKRKPNEQIEFYGRTVQC